MTIDEFRELVETYPKRSYISYEACKKILQNESEIDYEKGIEIIIDVLEV